MVSDLLKGWQDDFATVKSRGMVLELFEKKRDAIPPHSTPPQALMVGMSNWSNKPLEKFGV
jgi:hypothetical protein